MAESNRKVAIITGAASGMGLAVARLLSSTSTKQQQQQQNGAAEVATTWSLHLFDIDQVAGQAAASEIPGAAFHKVDISLYDSLAAAFHAVWVKEMRLDFVFANAGLMERGGFWDDDVCGDGGGDDGGDERQAGPPPELGGWAAMDVNFKGTVNTCYLARHYFRLDGRKDGVIVVTGSCTALVSC